MSLGTVSSHVGEMMTSSFRIKAISWFLFMLGLLAAPAMGQQLISTPTEKFMTSPGGVDLRTGQYAYEETDLSIGGETGGLALTRTSVQAMAGYDNPFGTFSHNWDIAIFPMVVDAENRREGGSNAIRVLVQYGARTRTFDMAYVSGNPTFNSVSDGPLSYLNFTGTQTGTGTVYTYTAADGTVVVFHHLGAGDCAAMSCALASEVTEPDGTHYTLSYAGSAGSPRRLQRVISSRGYALLFEGSGQQITKACIFNLALTTLPANNLCSANAQATAAYTYVTAGLHPVTLVPNVGLASVTRPDNSTSSFVYTGLGQNGPTTIGFVRPGETTPWLVNTMGAPVDYSSYFPYSVHRQDFADGQSYTYGSQIGPRLKGNRHPSIGTGYAAAHGGGVAVRYDWIRRPGYDQPGEICITHPCTNDQPANSEGDDPRIAYQQTPGPVEIIQPNGRTTTFNYCDPTTFAGLPANVVYRCAVGPLASFTSPDGSRTELEYDTPRNITKVTRIARPGSVQPNLQPWPNIVTTAGFDTTNIRSQNKPLWMTDANGNTTNYTYDLAHGGLLTETGPAPTSGAPRPQTRHAYALRKAWLWNGSGYTQAATGVYLRTATSLCRTSAATGNPAAPCTVAGDEVLTEYDYGPDDGSQGNTLLLRGQTVRSTHNGVTTTLRTCYGYDALGNRISETQPNGTINLGSCP